MPILGSLRCVLRRGRILRPLVRHTLQRASGKGLLLHCDPTHGEPDKEEEEKETALACVCVYHSSIPYQCNS